MEIKLKPMKNNIRRFVTTFAFAGFTLASASVTQAAVTQFVFLNGMTGANEVPPVSSTGMATINTISFDDAVGSFGTLTIDISFVGLSSNAASAHLHGFANASGTAGVLQGLSFTPATSGSVAGSWAPASATEASNLFAGLTYVNLHSVNFGGGELRGQLVPIPEPSVIGLTGLASLAFLKRRRK